jgi:hypothetical protein
MGSSLIEAPVPDRNGVRPRRPLIVRAVGRVARQTRAAVASGVDLLRVLALRLRRRSDSARWSSAVGLEPWWVERTRQMATLIPAGCTVLEFGAGACALRDLLHPTCRYIPSDLVSRGPDTIVLDLNHRPLPDLSDVRADVAVFAGVLEYLHDLPEVVRWLGTLVHTCVISYDVVPADADLSTRVSRKYDGLRHGYRNSMTESELLRLFSDGGFSCAVRQTWTRQGIYLLTRDAHTR